MVTRDQVTRFAAGLVMATGVAALSPAILGGQAQVVAGLTKAVAAPDAPRMANGKADIQGFWNAATITPFERPPGVGPTLTRQEAAALERASAQRRERAAQPSSGDRLAPPVGGDGSTGAAGNVGAYNNFWIDSGENVVLVNGQPRTSIVVEPADGRVPQVTPEAQQRNARRSQVAQRLTSDAAENAESRAVGAFDDVELRPLAERCLLGFGSTSGPPALPVLYNNIKQIVVGPDTVTILNEMVHDVRIVRMNTKEHQPKSVRKWLGDSIGWWEGDTLVVETTNFTDKTRYRGSTPDLKVTERFTRVSKTQLLYQFTVEDPATWPRPWSGEYNWVLSDEPIYEYACHEGNHAMTGILKGERLLEKENAAREQQQRRQQQR
jgi:hypothetical protein